SNEEGFLIQEILRGALHSTDIDSRPAGGPAIGAILELANPARQAKVADIDEADAILVLGTDPMGSSPILDLRIRKAIRRNGARLVVATERPTALDGGAEAIARYAPGQASYFVGALAAAVGGGVENIASPIAETLREAGKVVVVWGERIGASATNELLGLADALNVGTTDGAGLLEIPEATNARGLREAGVIPDAGPGLAAVAGGRGTEAIRQALIDGELDGVLLVGVDPLRDFGDTAAWTKALDAASFVVAFSTFTAATAAKADVLFPLETHAEKDGTVTHPDGRLQRVRPAAGRPGDIRPGWQTLADLSLSLGHDTGISSQPTAFKALTTAIPFYASITDSDIGGRGVRWQETESASKLPTSGAEAGTQAPGAGADSPDTQRERASAEAVPVTGALPELQLGTYRDIWSGPITELNPPLKFLKPSQHLELSPEDAQRLGLATGDKVRVTQGDRSLEATALIKERTPEGVCFLAEAIPGANANSLLNGHQVRVGIEKLAEVTA
ncbi:MAG TPA: molybdopterin-dependent oxidoreductase, partial [Solirubrobacterales bacterium]|nr:molybdopterin-dependent oxidoreductase [Solirubrobacterales bacterium]